MPGETNGVAAAAAAAATSSAVNPPPPFLSKTYDMVDDASTDTIVSWGKNGNSFIVWKDADCATYLLPKYFKHKNFSSFVRQLNTYGFRKIDSDRWEFANEGFLKGQKHLLKTISRRKSAAMQSHQLLSAQSHSTSTASRVEIAKSGIEEDVDSLKKDKNVLMQELVSLRQQQQATDHQLQTVVQRVHLMELRQQQMMSFLAKAMQSPGFLSQLLTQQTESNRRITGGNKKRRLPRQDEEVLVGKSASPLPDGKVVKYQPLMNEAAKAMLRQILKINASTRLEPTIATGNGFLIDGVPSPSPTDIDSSSSRISEVNLPELLPCSLKSHSASAGSVSQPSATISDTQCSSCIASTQGTRTQFPVTNDVLSTDQGLFSETEPIMAEIPIAGPDAIVSGSSVENMEYMDMISSLDDGAVPVPMDGFSCDHDIDVLVDENPKLPGINDVFWEQFLSASPFTGNMDETSSHALEGASDEQDLHTEQGSAWESTKHMNHLTKQMGLLASGSAA